MKELKNSKDIINLDDGTYPYKGGIAIVIKGEVKEIFVGNLKQASAEKRFKQLLQQNA